MNSLRKTHIADLVTKVLTESNEYTAMDLIRATLRRKNFKRKSVSPVALNCTDEEFAQALEKTLEEIKNVK
tara:strand:- start:174 stop:386 length:213 start_codon:yes stop_codon:yes gene_type:complete